MDPQEPLDYDGARRFWGGVAIAALLLVGPVAQTRVVACVPARGFDATMPPALLLCWDPDTGRPFVIPTPWVPR